MGVYFIWRYYESQSGQKLQPIKGIKLGILGMKGAGKTRLYSYLNPKMEYVEGQTYMEPYSSFSYKKKDGTIVNIEEGIDIGGGEDEAKEFMHQFLQEKDSIIFIFDICKYSKNMKYKEITNARIDYINSCRREGTKICFLLSHVDMLGNTLQTAKIISSFQKEMKDKPYGTIVLNNFAPVNITDSNQLMTIENKLFP